MSNLFASIEDFEVCGTAADGASAVTAALDLQPDVVLMDLAMPGMNGTEATARISDAAPHVGVVVMTMLDEDDVVIEALRAGARGYIVKGAQQQEILDVIRNVHAGRAVIGTSVARQLATLIAPGPPLDPFPDLTSRERDVLTAMTAGATTAQIGARLGLADKTVRNHISNLLTKLEVLDRTQAVLKARGARLGPRKP